jgi:hypothetical protein
MTLHRSDYDQAARYLKYACELLEGQAFGKTVAIREVLQMAAARLSPGDHYVGDAAPEITVPRQVADKVPIADARTEILKAIAANAVSVAESSTFRATRAQSALTITTRSARQSFGSPLCPRLLCSLGLRAGAD